MYVKREKGDVTTGNVRQLLANDRNAVPHVSFDCTYSKQLFPAFRNAEQKFRKEGCEARYPSRYIPPHQCDAPAGMLKIKIV